MSDTEDNVKTPPSKKGAGKPKTPGAPKKPPAASKKPVSKDDEDVKEVGKPPVKKAKTTTPKKEKKEKKKEDKDDDEDNDPSCKLSLQFTMEVEGNSHSLEKEVTLPLSMGAKYIQETGKGFIHTGALKRKK